MEHGLGTFVRLIRALLGSDAIASEKTEFGMELVILGIMACSFCVSHETNVVGVGCKVRSSKSGVKFNVCEKKAKKWRNDISMFIESSHLDSGSAQKLAGRLNFATQHLFHRLGRAMIRPIYAQKASGSGRISQKLLEALWWWHDILCQGVTEERQWMRSDKKICRLFVDAASTPACCAAVLCMDGAFHYTCAAPDQSMIDQLMQRRDKQITSLASPCVSGRCSRCSCNASGNPRDAFGSNNLCQPFVRQESGALFR